LGWTVGSQVGVGFDDVLYGSKKKLTMLYFVFPLLEGENPAVH
jgi:hypothetical protein